MADWAAFAGLTGVVLVLLLALSYLTTTALDESGILDSDGDRPRSDGTDRSDDADGGHPVEGTAELEDADRRESEGRAEPSDASGSADTASGAADASEASDSSLEGAPDGAPGPRNGTDDRTSTRAGGESASAADHPASSPVDETERSDVTGTSNGTGRAPGLPDGTDRLSDDTISTGEMLANVAVSQGLFAAVLIAAAVYTEIPPAALGIVLERSALADGLAIGVGLGLALHVANELGSLIAKRLGIDHDEELRELLAPESVGGWLALLVLILPLIAVFEEFLFRAALVGAFSTGFGLSPWLLAVLSSVAFAIGHGIQGPTGVVVTGLLGLVLAAAFVVTGSLLVVVVAHYLVNALEFLVHEGLGLEWDEVG